MSFRFLYINNRRKKKPKSFLPGRLRGEYYPFSYLRKGSCGSLHSSDSRRCRLGENETELEKNTVMGSMARREKDNGLMFSFQPNQPITGSSPHIHYFFLCVSWWLEQSNFCGRRGTTVHTNWTRRRRQNWYFFFFLLPFLKRRVMHH